MAKRIINVLIILIMVSGLGGTGYLLYVKNGLDAEIVFLNKEIDDGKKRIRAVQKKYAQEKAKLGTCMRMKMAEEIKNAKLIKQISEFEKVKFAVQNQLEGFEKKVASLNTIIEKLKTIRTELEESRQKVVEKYRASVRSEREKMNQIKDLETKKKALEFEISHLEKELDRNFKHNRKLSEIAEELTKKYREKAGYGSDPFTKLGMIEMEHLLQDYIKKIDKEKIIEQ
jgi:chromosome segregation ATPase